MRMKQWCKIETRAARNTRWETGSLDSAVMFEIQTSLQSSDFEMTHYYLVFKF